MSQGHQITKANLSRFSYQGNPPNRIKVLIYASLEAINYHHPPPQIFTHPCEGRGKHLTPLCPVLFVKWVPKVTQQVTLQLKLLGLALNPTNQAIIFSTRMRTEKKTFLGFHLFVCFPHPTKICSFQVLLFSIWSNDFHVQIISSLGKLH